MKRIVLVSLLTIIAYLWLSSLPVCALPGGAVARLGIGEISGADRAVAFSPDGAALAVATSIGVYLCNSTTLEEIAFLETNTAMDSVAFSPDGSLLASGSWDDTILLWDVSTYQEVATLMGHSSIVTSVAFSPDGSLLASGSRDDTVKLWDVSTRQEVVTLTGHSDWVYSVAFSPDGSLLASGSSDHTVLLWDMTPYMAEKQDIERITILPLTVTLKPGGTQQFTVRAYDASGRAVDITNTDVTWIVGGDIGVISGNGLFTASTVGSGAIKATLKTDTAIEAESRALTVEAGDTVELILSEPASKLKTGEEYQFTVTGKDAYGNDVALQSSDVIWSVVNGVGFISPTGIFVSTEAGSSSVKVTLKADPGVTATTQSFTIQMGQAVQSAGKLTISWSGVKDGEDIGLAGALPLRFALRQNYPNPFNPETWIPYQLTDDNDVVISIYDSTGRLIRKLELGHRPAGYYLGKDKAAYWDGRNDQGERAASGVYFYQFMAGDFAAIHKLVITK